jgi:hypothetical protein
MREAAALFAREPHVRTGEPTAKRRAVGGPGRPGTDEGAQSTMAGNGEAAIGDTATVQSGTDRTAAQIAAECFPGTVADAVDAAWAGRSVATESLTAVRNGHCEPRHTVTTTRRSII